MKTIKLKFWNFENLSFIKILAIRSKSICRIFFFSY